MRTPKEIILSFIENKYVPMYNIENNKIFVTDNTASTLVWVENNVVIEHYFLFPNKITPMHSHPFKNLIIFLGGSMITRRQISLHSNEFEEYVLDETKIGNLSSICEPGFKHGFTVGPSGASIFNIQIWNDNVVDPKSAAMHYNGDSMGPEHLKLIKI